MSEMVSVKLPVWFRVLARYVADQHGESLEQYLEVFLVEHVHDVMDEAVELHLFQDTDKGCAC